MSAYIVDDEVIDQIVGYLSRHHDGVLKAHKSDPAELGRALFALNVSSVSQLYHGGAIEDLPGKIGHYEYTHTDTDATRAEAFEALGCWTYQSCEGDANRDPLYLVMEALKAEIEQDIAHNPDPAETPTTAAPMATARYIDVAETAKLIRRCLKRTYPAVKFSVRSSRYSMGASIDVRWTDGPAEFHINPLVQAYAGADFDGMIDLKTHNSHYMIDDGTVRIARVEDTAASRGSIEGFQNRPPCARCGALYHEPGQHEYTPAEVVQFGADFISCSRQLTNGEQQAADAADRIRKLGKCDGEPPNDQFGNRWVTDLSWQVAHGRDEGETIDAAIDRIVFRN